ncbi:MAG: hypothetical protein JNM84_12260 [Planctomycetes bacterium]|nr:hypothetical protein [Planctomycetota bacterium]
MRSPLSFAALALAFCPGLTAAADLVVGPAGSGAPYTSIRAAVDAANPGDRVLVSAGLYSEHVVVSKPIELIGAGSGLTVIQSFPVGTPLPTLFPPLGITGIGAGQRAVVRGFRLELGPVLRVFSFPNAMAYATGCAGRLELSDLNISGGGLPMVPLGGVGGVLLLRDCAQVVIDGVRTAVTATPVSGPFQGTEGLSGLFAERSRAWVSRCDFRGTSAGTRSGGISGDPGAGMRAFDSEVTLARTRLEGGGGAAGSLASAVAGGAGIEARNSAIAVHGGDGAAIVGADARETLFLLFFLYNSGGHAIEADATSSIALAPDVLLVAGAPSANLPAGQPIVAASGASVAVLPERAPSLAFLPQIGALGSNSTVQYQGEPGSIHARFLSFASGDALALPGIEGALLLDLLTFFYIETVTLDGLGQATRLAPIPPDPLLAGLGLVEQTVQLSPLGLRFAPPALKSIGL